MANKPPRDHKQDLHDRAKGRHDKTLNLEDLRELRKNALTREERYQALLGYYLTTDEGRAEFANSPHANRRLESVVEDLCKELDTWEDDGRSKKHE